MVVILAGTLLWTLRPSDEPSPIRDRALAIVERGVALEARGDDEGAREAYQEAIEVDPALPSPWNNLALLAAERGDPLAADSLLSRALVLDPAYAAAWWNRGDVAWDLGQLDLAEEHYRRALAADPELHEASVNLGSLLIERDRYEDALALSASTLQRSPVAPIDDYLRRNVARALDALGRTDEAREVWRELLESEVPELQALARGALESDRSE
jgi:Flp pilus assembly protein TadD